MTSDEPARDGTAPCCPLPPGVAPLDMGPGISDERLDRLARWAHALSDPIRLRMLDLMVKAQECCRPGGETERAEAMIAGGEADRRASAPASPEGVCVCELQSLQGLAQSKASYHLKVLRDAGLVREQRRGKWSFYAVDEAAANECAAAVRAQLGV